MDYALLIHSGLLTVIVFQAHAKNVNSITNINGESIPRIMHHVYWDWDKRNNTDRVTRWQQCRATCVEKSAGFRHILWNEVMIGKLMQEDYPWLVPLYRSYPYNVQRSAVARYMILYHMGGIYLDMDDCCRITVETLLRTMEKQNETFLLPEGRPAGTGNDIIVVTKQHDFMAYVLKNLAKTNKWYVIPYTTVLMSTGMLYMNARFREYRRNHPDFRYRILSYTDKWNVYLYHEEGETWHQWDGVIFNHIHRNSYMYIAALTVAIVIVILRAVMSKREINFFIRKRPKNF